MTSVTDPVAEVGPKLPGHHSKLVLAEDRVPVPVTTALELVLSILTEAGCTPDTANTIARHLVDADLCGVESHGIVRALQYSAEFRRGYMKADVKPTVDGDGAMFDVDGGGGIGITAMELAVREGCVRAKTHGVVAVAVRNTGHTGRLGAFAETAALNGCLAVICGGGARDRWPMVAPYGGRKGVLPTNPWCFGIPGGDRGPVVVDFATGMIAGGWIYAARRAGAILPEGALIDRDGNPTLDPADYFNGGAILSKGGAMGYGLATVAELICDAMLGPAAVESNTILLLVDTTRYKEQHALQAAAEEILSDLRACPPAPGFAVVEVPGERERAHRQAAQTLSLPVRIWEDLIAAGPAKAA